MLNTINSIENDFHNSRNLTNINSRILEFQQNNSESDFSSEYSKLNTVSQGLESKIDEVMSNLKNIPEKTDSIFYLRKARAELTNEEINIRNPICKFSNSSINYYTLPNSESTNKGIFPSTTCLLVYNLYDPANGFVFVEYWDTDNNTSRVGWVEFSLLENLNSCGFCH